MSLELDLVRPIPLFTNVSEADLKEMGVYANPPQSKSDAEADIIEKVLSFVSYFFINSF